MVHLLDLLNELDGHAGQLAESVMFGCGSVEAEAEALARLARRIARHVASCGARCTDRLTADHASRRLIGGRRWSG